MNENTEIACASEHSQAHGVDTITHIVWIDSRTLCEKTLTHCVDRLTHIVLKTLTHGVDRLTHIVWIRYDLLLVHEGICRHTWSCMCCCICKNIYGSMVCQQNCIVCTDGYTAHAYSLRCTTTEYRSTDLITKTNTINCVGDCSTFGSIENTEELKMMTMQCQV